MSPLAFVVAVLLGVCSPSSADVPPPGGWVHWRPQAAPPHATVLNTFRANLPAYYLLPPPPPVFVPAAPVAPPVPVPVTG